MLLCRRSQGISVSTLRGVGALPGLSTGRDAERAHSAGAASRPVGRPSRWGSGRVLALPLQPAPLRRSFAAARNHTWRADRSGR